MLRLFRVADERGTAALPLGARTGRSQALARARRRARAATRRWSTRCKALLTRPGTRGEFLLEMHELGVLGALLPEFGRVTAQHQHDLYHVYTVDVHSLFAVRRLYALRAGDLRRARSPSSRREMRELDDPLPLYLGMLLHDAGKGMGGNHSEKGQRLMAALGERLGSHRPPARRSPSSSCSSIC